VFLCIAPRKRGKRELRGRHADNFYEIYLVGFILVFRDLFMFLTEEFRSKAYVELPIDLKEERR